MNIKNQLKNDLIKALKEKNSDQAQLLRTLNASIKNAEIEKKSQLKETDLIKLLRREVKQRKDSINQYQKGNRKDLAQKEQNEIKIIEKYLPKMMSDDEVKKEVRAAIEKTGALQISDLGRVMAEVMGRLENRADGSQVSRIAKKLLS